MSIKTTRSTKMGVKLLSTLLKSHCPDVVNKINLSRLRGKKVCVDTSIYLYRFKSQNNLIEKFYLMCSLFRYYEITPVFIFDGKPPAEKYEVLRCRRQKRKEARDKYMKLLETFGSVRTKNQDDILSKLKRNFTKISKTDIEEVKALFNAYGIKYMEAQGEADVLCASLVLNKKVYAVLTEDMDLFAYGCANVLRYFSLANHNCLLYNLNKILKKLSINLEDFQTLCILSGTDYYKSRKNIFSNLKLYYRFKDFYNGNTFFEWLIKYGFLNRDDGHQVSKILDKYINIENELSKYKYIPIIFGQINKEKLYNILKKDRFIIY